MRFRRSHVWALLVVIPACDSRCAAGPQGNESKAVVEEAARKTTALAALFTSAAQVADEDQRQVLSKYGIAQRPFAELEEAFPERRELIQAVEAWPESRKRAALSWLLENATWATLLHAMAIESFDSEFEARAWGPSMEGYAPEIHAKRASLAALLREALEDESIRRIAKRVAQQPEPFTPEGIQERREALIRYLRFEDELPAFHAFHASLLAPGTGVNAVLPDGSVLMIVGPSRDPSFRSMVLYHEMAHQPVHRVLVSPKAAAALESCECAYESVEEKYGYTTWGSYFAENLVRALSYRLEGREAPVGSGFLFEGPLTQMLASWEESEASFEDFVLVVLDKIREEACDATARPACPEPSQPLPSGTCLVLPEGADPDLPLAIYLHGMSTHPGHALGKGMQFARIAGDRLALLLPLGRRGECAWSPEVERHLCWPAMPDRMEAVDGLLASLQADLEEVRRRLGREEAITPFLVGHSNGGYGAYRIAAGTEMPLAGLAILHAGFSSGIQREHPVPTLLCAARGDEWHFPAMQALHEHLAAAEWPLEWREREGGHAQTDEDLKTVVDFILRTAVSRAEP